MSCLSRRGRLHNIKLSNPGEGSIGSFFPAWTAQLGFLCSVNYPFTRVTENGLVKCTSGQGLVFKQQWMAGDTELCFTS